MKPFSLGKYLQLSKYDSPFIASNPVGYEITNVRNAVEYAWKDLAFALNVCARSNADFENYINTPSIFEKENAQWNRILLKHIKKTPDFNIYDVRSQFQDYIESAMQIPKWWNLNDNKHSSDRKSTKHWTESILDCLVTKGNRTKNEVLDLYLAESFLSSAYLAEDNGGILLWNDADYEAIESNQTIGISADGWKKLCELRKDLLCPV